jgi:hypothetical protein
MLGIMESILGMPEECNEPSEITACWISDVFHRRASLPPSPMISSFQPHFALLGASMQALDAKHAGHFFAIVTDLLEAISTASNCSHQSAMKIRQLDEAFPA